MELTELKKDQYYKKLLRDLTDDLLDKIENEKNTILVKVPRTYSKYKIVEYDYPNAFYKPIPSYRIVDEWTILDRYNFIDNFIMGSSTYANSISRIIENYIQTRSVKKHPNIHELDVIYTMINAYYRRYFDFILDIAIERFTNSSCNLDRKYINSNINALINDIICYLDKSAEPTINYKIKILLSGIILDVNHLEIPCDLYTKFIIRKPEISDLEVESLVNDKTFIDPFDTLGDTTAIIEFDINCTKSNLEDKLLLVHVLLRLFNTSSIISLKVFVSTNDSIIDRAYITKPKIQLSKKHHNTFYHVNKNDGEYLSEFMKEIVPSFSDLIQNNNSVDQIYINMAYYFYEQALVQQLDIRIRIAFVITSLETLYRKDHERDRISKADTICKRISIMFKLYNISTENLPNKITNGYRIRNYVYHGNELETTHDTGLYELFKSLIEYCRISIVIFSLFRMEKKDINDILIKFNEINNDYENNLTLAKELQGYINVNIKRMIKINLPLK